jgi:hypothetical protein
VAVGKYDVKGFSQNQRIADSLKCAQSQEHGNEIENPDTINYQDCLYLYFNRIS